MTERDAPSYGMNAAVRPSIMDILCQVRWADWQATPPTVLDISDGSTMDIYSFLAAIGRRESRAEIDAALAQRFPASEYET